MAEPISEHHHHTDEGSGMGFLLGIVLLAVILFLFFYYGLPFLRNSTATTPQVNVPGQIDVNVNQKK